MLTKQTALTDKEQAFQVAKFHNRFLPCFAAGFVLALLGLLIFFAVEAPTHFQTVLTVARPRWAA
jgi:hypothetical protein